MASYLVRLGVTLAEIREMYDLVVKLHDVGVVNDEQQLQHMSLKWNAKTGVGKLANGRVSCRKQKAPASIAKCCSKYKT